MSSTGGPISRASGSLREGMTGSSGQLTEQALLYEVHHFIIYVSFSRFGKLTEKINDKAFDLFGLSELEQ